LTQIREANAVKSITMALSAATTAGNPLSSFWEKVLSRKLTNLLEKWDGSFDTQDDARLVRKSMLRECAGDDIQPDIWAQFLKDLLYQDDPASYPFEVIDRILKIPSDAAPEDLSADGYTAPGFNIAPPTNGNVCHYMRLDRFIERTTGMPLGGDRTVEIYANEIRSGRVTENTLEGRFLGTGHFPVWVTDDSLSHETASDVVRNRLALRSLHSPGHRLIELKYDAALLVNGIRAPTVLDAWRGGSRQSWIFTKRKQGEINGPAWGYTIDLDTCHIGAPEAVHAPLRVSKEASRNIKLRVLEPTSSSPPELSLFGLLESTYI